MASRKRLAVGNSNSKKKQKVETSFSDVQDSIEEIFLIDEENDLIYAKETVYEAKAIVEMNSESEDEEENLDEEESAESVFSELISNRKELVSLSKEYLISKQNSLDREKKLFNDSQALVKEHRDMLKKALDFPFPDMRKEFVGRLKEQVAISEKQLNLKKRSVKRAQEKLEDAKASLRMNYKILYDMLNPPECPLKTDGDREKWFDCIEDEVKYQTWQFQEASIGCNVPSTVHTP